MARPASRCRRQHGAGRTPLLERQKGFIVDGNVTSQWNAAVDPADSWLVLDFGAEVTINPYSAEISRTMPRTMSYR